MATETFVDFAAIKNNVSIADLIPWLMLKGTWHGDQWRGACPHCKSGGDRALVVTKSKSAFYCWALKKGGDCINLVAHVKDISQRDAAQIITDHFKLNPPTRSQQQAKAGFDADKYAATLDPGHASLETLGVSPQALKEWRAGYSATGILRGRLALPVTRDGQIVAYIGRAVKDESPLLVFPNGFVPQDYIFGEDKVTEGILQLVRDPLDVIRAQEAGMNVVCFITETISAQQLETLAALMDRAKCDALELF